MNFTAKIKIALHEKILDVQGKAVEKALQSIDYDMMSNVRIGKYVTLDVQAADRATAETLTREACEKLIANPIIEHYEIEIEDAE